MSYYLSKITVEVAGQRGNLEKVQLRSVRKPERSYRIDGLWEYHA